MKTTPLWLVLLAACGTSAPPPVQTPGEAATEVAVPPPDGTTPRRAEARRRDNTNAPVEVVGPPVVVPPQVEVARLRIEPGPGPRRGAAQPLVTIVEFTDFQCPFCRRVQPTLARLLREHPGEVQLVVRHNPLPFHPDAMPSAELALEAYAQGGAELFWRMHDLLFQNSPALSRADLEGYASSLGMNLDTVRRALDTHRHRPQITADQQAAAAVGARGTPTFFLNGRQIVGAQPYERFQQVLAEELETARGLVQGGVRSDQVYAHLQRGASTAPAPPRRAPQPSPSTVYRVPVEGRPQDGPADALVTVVMFTDLQCPYCARVAPTIAQLRAAFGLDLRVIHRHNPLSFHTDAMTAAEVAEEVFTQRGDQAFFQFTALCFQNQRALGEADLIGYATRVGARARGVRRALRDHRHQATIARDQSLARSLGATGTPFFFLNGRGLRGAQPYAAFEALVQELLPVARARVASGVRRSEIYATLTDHGATAPPPGSASPRAPAPPPPDGVYAIPVPSSAPARGPANAPVTP